MCVTRYACDVADSHDFPHDTLRKRLLRGYPGQDYLGIAPKKRVNGHVVRQMVGDVLAEARDVTRRNANRTTRLVTVTTTASGTFKEAFTKQGSALHRISNAIFGKGGQTSKSFVFAVGLPWTVDLDGKEELVAVIVI